MKKLLYYDDVYDEDGEPQFTDKVIDELQQLSEIVCNNHFGYVGYHDREDLISEGKRKALELILSKRFDPSYGSPLRNFIYTGMRNEMTNYLYSKKREYPVEEFYGDQKKSESIVLDDYRIDYNEIKEFVDRYKRRYGDYSGAIIDKLEDLGFSIFDKGEITYKDNINNTLLEKLVVMCVWKIQGSFH